MPRTTNLLLELKAEKDKLTKQSDKDQYQRLIDYVNMRLLESGLSIFDYNGCDGVREDYMDIHPLIQELKQKGIIYGD